MFELLEKVHETRETLADRAGTPLPGQLSESELIDLVRELEDLKSTAAALQARATVDFADQREAAEECLGVPASQRGRGVGAEIALARRESPTRGGRHLGLAKALVDELPHSFTALREGSLSEWRATLIARETACLGRGDRAEVDRQLNGPEAAGWGDRRLVAEARRLVYRIDPHGLVDRARKAAADRHVSIRPAPDTMVRFSALLPVADGVACYAALKGAADTARSTGDERSRGQVMADAMVERLTGRSPAVGPDVAVKLVLTDRTLFQGNSEPAHLEGYDTVPAQWARDLITHATNSAVGLWFQQLYTHPGTGALVAQTSRSRTAPAGLADFIATRDQTCRTPYCDAPIRHTDHVHAVATGGPTTTENTQALCEACNYAKQAPGWVARAGPGPRHTVHTRTPTGHHHRSTAPPTPGHQRERTTS
ncbi:DUF222 domain-containing protein [Nocardioides panacisoli]|uniref:HNH endonuclease n=1 Tax=Nocardioides panacisoli TaxID=627624 RepID=UPI001C627F57|nr:DUF222 domain-containing protein [Nocardioides panacisoli]QYJ02872.1 DUF222 domain-containing protein [Nocardioides panacisoli]